MSITSILCPLFSLFLLANANNNRNVPQATGADKLTSLRNDMRTLLAQNSRGGSNFLPLEAQQYKCQVLNALYRTARQKYPNLPNGVLSLEMKNMLDNCATRDFRISDFFSQPFIFPGTNYCGQGNIAENYHDLGVFNETDACCREHDYCDDIIRPGRTKHNLINPFGTTRLHCKCDQALRDCFRKANSVVSNTVGYIFFSVLQTQCFDFDYPASGCLLWRRGSVRMYCVKYKLDEDQPKKWQWFDQEPYL
ncbi:phospholipase A2 [Trichonephila inaurata madagascariensis]|uniref:Phospholipase A2 n=1 Tax=Trichonephila inaurata madagascariensis TaxID=2747483 RepID=A0A8X6YIP2_9ARAC|nr:phospholipase A2 [Trichonephila inaurata madagascariensis]